MMILGCACKARVRRDGFGIYLGGFMHGGMCAFMPPREVFPCKGFHYCACPVFLTRLGLMLGSQFIYIVGYEFPTTGSSQPDYLAVLLCLHETSPSPLSSFLWLVLSLFSSLFSLRMTNPFSLLTSPIYSLRLVECSWLRSGLTCVGGVRFDYS